MTLNDNKSDNTNHLFSDKLRKYENKFVEFLLDIAETKRVNPKISTISSYLLIHGKLTQKELKELTGFSIGSISTFLSVMTGTGAFVKERIPGTHTYTYTFSGDLEDLTTKGLEIALSSFNSFESYLISVKKKLANLVDQSKEGAELLSQRIDELLEAFEIYKLLFPTITQDSVKEIERYISLETLRITLNKSSTEKIRFDEEVYLIEDDMINQLISTPMFSSRDIMFIRILGYFMTRKYLSQSRIQRITGLSAGKVSEEVNLLLKNNLIKKVRVSDKGKITYGADSAGKMLLKFSRSIVNRMAKWYEELKKMGSELENKKDELQSLDGYSRIYKIYQYLLDSILKYKRFIDLVDKVI
jgi:DNA-binding transcriptional regulator GbsR (MarR family)